MSNTSTFENNNKFIITIGSIKKNKSGTQVIKKFAIKINNSNIEDHLLSTKIKGHIFTYNGNAIDIILDVNNEPWFRGFDVYKPIGYKYCAQAIHLNVARENKQSFGKLTKLKTIF